MNPYRIQRRQPSSLSLGIDRMFVQQHLQLGHQAPQPACIAPARQNLRMRIRGSELWSYGLHLQRLCAMQ
jgi:hypothetical protein